MKKVFLLSLLLFQLTVSYAQQKKEVNTKGNKGLAGSQLTNRYTPPPNVNRNDQAYTNQCYKNLEFTVKNYGYNKDGGFYSWGIKVKNNYSKAVSLRYRLIVGGDTSPKGTLTYVIKPGETYVNDYGTIRAIIVSNNSTKYEVIVSEVCFDGQDCNKNGYADCNGKQTINNAKGDSNSPNGNLSKSAIDMQKIEVKPEYPGGIGQAYNFIGRNLKYPVEAAENNIQGTVIVSFVVEIDGSITDIEIVQKLGHGCDEEVIRIISSMQKWKPGMQKGKPVRVKYILPVKFKLSE